MNSLRVNADYESVLFHHRPQQKINEAIEFFAFYLSDRPLLTQKNYSKDFLESIEFHTRRKCVIKKNGDAENWWGELRDIKLEQWLNSKLTSTELIIKENWSPETYLLRSEEKRHVPFSKTPMISKDPFEMSGRGFRLYPNGLNEKSISDFENKTLILEPLLNRTYDFSHYVFPDGKVICYQNLVDQKFQYKGTLFRDWKSARIEDLNFYSLIPLSNWVQFKLQLETIKSYYAQKVLFSELKFGFSIDSLVYDQTKIHPLCEVNFRRTMGRVAYEFSEIFAQDKKWTLLLLLPTQKECRIKLMALVENNKLMVLSPEDSRFTMLFLMANSAEEGKKMADEIKYLLSLSELPVNI
jgi:hypothetical protein